MVFFYVDLPEGNCYNISCITILDTIDKIKGG